DRVGRCAEQAPVRGEQATRRRRRTGGEPGAACADEDAAGGAKSACGAAIGLGRAEIDVAEKTDAADLQAAPLERREIGAPARSSWRGPRTALHPARTQQ